MHLVRRRESRCDLRRRDLPNVHPTGGWVRPVPVAVRVAVGPEALAKRRCRDHTKSDGNEQNQRSRIRYTHRVLLWDHWLQRTIHILVQPLDLNKLELLYELAYLRFFIQWEVFLEQSFLRYLCGYSSSVRP